MSRIEIRAGHVDRSHFYDPWLPAGPGVRWHVMGESHYINPGDPASYANSPQLTQQVVKDWALGDSGAAFFTRVASVVSGKEPTTFDRGEEWHKFAFSNFVQQPLDGPRIAPSSSQFEDARARFFSQLAATQPEVLVVLGSRAWNQLPSDVGAKVPPFRFAVEPDWPEIDDAGLYPFWVEDELVCTLAIKIVHPSAGFGRWNLAEATKRAQTAGYCHSNVLEHFYEAYVGVGERPFWG